MPEGSLFERVTLDSSVLLGSREPELLAAADLGYYRGYWSSWIMAEFARVRAEWIIRRAARESLGRSEAEQHHHPERRRLPNRPIPGPSGSEGCRSRVPEPAQAAWVVMSYRFIPACSRKPLPGKRRDRA